MTLPAAALRAGGRLPSFLNALNALIAGLSKIDSYNAEGHVFII